MNKVAVVGLVLLLILGGGGYYLYNNSQSRVSPVANNETNATASQKFSLKSLMGFAGNQTCTFTDATGNSSGTVYVDSGKMRGDFQTVINDQTTASHVISDGSTMYMWMDGQTTGFKYSLATLEEFTKSQDSATKSSAAQAVDLNKEADYSCNGGAIDAAKFTVPTEIQFTDYSAMMENLGSKVPDAAASCSTCDSLPAESKAACRTALKCN